MAEQEDWLLPVEAEELICDRLHVPTGKAQAILEEARASKEVRWEPPLRNLIDENGHLDFDFEMPLTTASIERQHGRHINKSDLLYWLEHHHAGAPKRAPAASNRSSPALIEKTIDAYARNLASNRNPSMADAREFAAKAGIEGHRDEIDDAYRRRFGNPGRGRPRKKSG